MKWFPGRTGFTGSVCIAGFGFGAVLWIPLETAFVNPDNVAPVHVEGVEDDKYVVRTFQLLRVPPIFMLTVSSCS